MILGQYLLWNKPAASLSFQLMPPDVTIVEEHKRDVSEAKQLDRKLVKLVLPTDKNEEKDKEDDKNEKVSLNI